LSLLREGSREEVLRLGDRIESASVALDEAKRSGRNRVSSQEE